MNGRVWFQLAVVLDIGLLLLGLYMAVSAAEIAIRTGGDAVPVIVTLVFGVLPVFCVVAPFASLRARRRNRSGAHVVFPFAACWAYALFLLVFLFNS